MIAPLRCAEADAAKEAGKPRIDTEWIEDGLVLQERQSLGTLGESLFEPEEGRVVFAEADVADRDVT
jgi:hypothetical protein